MKKVNKNKKERKTKDTKGLTVDKDDFSDWFTQLMIKADLADYTAVSGCIVFKPTAWAIWEKIVELVNERLKKIGVKNVYFPMFIPESLLIREKEHLKGFNPEVAWVTEAGGTKLGERLAVRPTSEAIMYDSFAKWIRSWRDLPLRYNQWSNVVRWEFKHPTPFLRTREFVFNEGHTVFASKDEAEAEKEQIIGMYKEVCEDYLALPSLIGKKSNKEKFAGADYTVSMEFYMPNGKAVQGPDFHHDGQNFSKAYNIKFLDKNGKEQNAWQNTWAISTRMLGVMFAVHSDSKGLIMPPKIAPNKIVIVPIYFDDSKTNVLSKAKEINKSLTKYNSILDERDEYNPGFKYNEWEMKGIPLRIEIGPKDLEKDSVVLVRRDNGKKENVNLKDLDKAIENTLGDIQKNLYLRAEKSLNGALTNAENKDSLKKAVLEKKIALVPLCGKIECEDSLKFESGGAKVLNIPEKQPAGLNKAECIICGKKAEYFGYAGKSY